MMLSLLFTSLLLFSASASSKIETRSVQDNSMGSLREDLKDFVNVIPIDDIRNLTRFYYARDPAMRSSYVYLRDDGFKRILSGLSTIPLVEKITTFLRDCGVIFSELSQQFEPIVLTKEDCNAIEEIEQRDMGGINAFFYETLQLIPQDELTTLFLVKLEHSKEFAKLLDNLNASDYENMMESLKKSHNLQELYFELYAHGIDVLDWAKSARGYLGY